MAVGVVGSLAAAPAAFATAPVNGAACQPDGKISGAGSTFQANGVNDAFTFGYQQNQCGAQPNVANLTPAWGTTDPSIFSFGTTSVQGMVAYNYSLGGTAASNGSGAGLNRLSCRTDMFSGTDLPYNSTQFTALKGAAGTLASVSGHCADGTVINTGSVPPPYGPQPNNTWPATGDTAATPMNFPTAGGAVAYAVNLNGKCTANAGSLSAALVTGTPITSLSVNALANAIPAGSTVLLSDGAGHTQAWDVTATAAAAATTITVASQTPNFAYPATTTTFTVAPTGLKFTANEFNKIWQGTINQWNDSELTATNPILTTFGCAGAIQRVVRFDNSGTTAITMFTLNGIDPQPATLCGTDITKTWLAIATASNNSGQWPQESPGTSPDCVDSTSNSAPNPVTAGTNGSPALITKLESTNGGIGYAELGLWGTPPSGVSFASVQQAESFGDSGTSDTPADPDTQGNPAFVSPGSPGAASNCKIPLALPSGLTTPNGSVGLLATNWENDPSGPLKPEGLAFQGFGYPACGLTFDMVMSKIHSGQTGQIAAPTGSTVAATAGCTISTPGTTVNNQATTANNAATTTQNASTTTNNTATTTSNPATTTTGVTLPASTIPVAANGTAGFPTSGTLNVGGQTVTYTGITGGATASFTGAAGGTGTIASGAAVTLVQTLPESIVTVASTTGFPTSGTLSVGGQTVTYTGTTSTTFTGASGGTGTIASGSAVTLVQSLPEGTVTVAPGGTAGFPTSGTLSVGGQTVTYTGITTTSSTGTTPATFTGASGGTGAVASGTAVTLVQSLPESTLAVVSTAGYPPSGTLNVGGQTVTYTGLSSSGPSFTGVAGGTGAVASGTAVTLVQSLPESTLAVASTAGFPASGTLSVDGNTLTYTGLTSVAFTGVTGGTGAIAQGDAVTLVQTLPQTTLAVASTSGYPTSGTLLVNGTQTVTYTGKTPGSFTGASGGTGALSQGATVSLVSTTAPAAGPTSPGINGACQTIAGATSPIVGMTNDQLQTLYGYFTYVLSPLGQSNLAAQTLDQLPAAWLSTEQAGFQTNF
jgi:hypothetical protein